MYWTLDRLLLIAVVITLISADGLYRAWHQRLEEKIGQRLFWVYVVSLVSGSTLAWIGFLIRWID
jgi:hypothetical protein